MLRDFARQLLATARKADSPAAASPIGTLSAISQLPVPYYGEVDGIGPVTVTADANMVGFSPVSKCRDSVGEIAWIPTDRILMTDARLQPLAGTGAAAGRASTPTAHTSHRAKKTATT